MTFKRPAFEEITLSHGSNTVRLRPSLRAATILEDKFGLASIDKGLAELDYIIVLEIILTCSITRKDAAAFHFSQAGRPLSQFFETVIKPLSDLVRMFVPAPVKADRPQTTTGQRMTFAEMFAALYDTATGFLEWSPEQAWNATPTEINRAYHAHLDKLKAIHGSNDKEGKQAIAPDPDASFDRSALESLRSNIVRHGR